MAETKISLASATFFVVDQRKWKLRFRLTVKLKIIRWNVEDLGDLIDRLEFDLTSDINIRKYFSGHIFVRFNSGPRVAKLREPDFSEC